MPTGRPRHTLTETDEITAALADAAARWPGLPPTELLKRLVAEGHAALRASLDAERAAVADTSGALTGIYQAGDLDTLRQDWPA
ncbi:MAG: hypothetical protein ACRDQ4_12855 [Pseudonocardiaceae bacterium]